MHLVPPPPPPPPPPPKKYCITLSSISCGDFDTQEKLKIQNFGEGVGGEQDALWCM